MVDLTTLEAKGRPGKLISLFQKTHFPNDDSSIPRVAAVRVYPAMVKYAVRPVKGTGFRRIN